MVTRLGLRVIDKLDLRIPNGSVLRPVVREYTRGLPYQTYTARVRPAVHYAGKADLRPVGIDAILPIRSKRTQQTEVWQTRHRFPRDADVRA